MLKLPRQIATNTGTSRAHEHQPMYLYHTVTHVVPAAADGTRLPRITSNNDDVLLNLMHGPIVFADLFNELMYLHVCLVQYPCTVCTVLYG